MTRPSQPDVCGRDWLMGDEPCPYPGGCSEPVRTHTHYHEAPGVPIRVVYYDEAGKGSSSVPEWADVTTAKDLAVAVQPVRKGSSHA